MKVDDKEYYRLLELEKELVLLKLRESSILASKNAKMRTYKWQICRLLDKNMELRKKLNTRLTSD